MADIVKDLLNRTVSSGIDPATFASMISEGITAEIENIVSVEPPHDKDRNDKLEEIRNLLSQISDQFDDSIKEQHVYANAVIEAAKSKGGGGATVAAAGGGGGGGGGGFSAMKIPGISLMADLAQKTWKFFKKDRKGDLATDKAMSDMARQATTKGSIFTHPYEQERLIQLLEAMADATKATDAGMARLLKQAAGKVKAGAIGMPDLEIKGLKGLMAGLGKSLNRYAGMFVAGLGIFKIFEGAIVQEYTYLRGMREIAYQTQGITGQMEDLQLTWTKLGDTVKYTGVNRTKFQQVFMKNLKKGTKGLMQSQKVIQTGLHLSRQLGDETLSIGDTFHDWHMTLGFGASELQAVAQGARETAKATGVTGENLVAALKDSEKLLTELRSAGNLTADAASNVIGTLAAARKYGVGAQVTEMQSALTSSHQLLIKSSGEMMNFWHQAARFAEAEAPGITAAMQSGQGLAADNLNKLWKGAAKNMRAELRQAGAQIGPDLKDILEYDLSELDPQMRASLDIEFKEIYGKGIEEVQRMVKAGVEGSMPFWEKMQLISGELADTSSKTGEEIKNLRQRERDAVFAQSSQFLAAYDKALGKSKSIGEALSDKGLRNTLEQGAENFEALVGSAFDPNAPKAAFEAAAMKQMEVLEAQASDLGVSMEFTKSDMKKAFASGDISTMREAIQKGNDQQQRLAKLTEDQTDPVKQVQRTIEEINGKIRQHTAGILTAVLGILGATGIMGTLLGIIAFKTFPGLGAGLGKMLLPGRRGFAVGYGRAGGGIRGVGAGLKKGIGTQWGRMSKGFTKTLSKMAPALNVVGKGAGTALKGAVSLGSKLPLVGTAIGSLAPATGTLATSLGGMGTAIAGIGLGPFLAVAAAAVGVIGGVTSAFIAGNKAAEVFGTTQEDLTVTQKLAAESAGFFTGILNTLTFGIFNKALGPTGSLTKKLAKLYDAFPPLMLGAQMILLPWKVLWGTLKGLYYFLKNIFIGIWEAVKAIIQPFMDAWKQIKEIFAPITKMLGGFGTKANKTMSIVSLLTNILGGLGKVIGWVFKAIGTVLGWLIKGYLKPFIGILKAIAKPIGNAIKRMKEAFERLKKVFKPVIDSVLKLWGSIKKAFGGMEGEGNMLETIFSGIGQVIAMLATPFQVLILAVSLLVGAFEFLATVFEGIVQYITGIAQILKGIFTFDFEKLKEGFKNVFGGLCKIFFDSFVNAIFGIWQSFKDAFRNALASLPLVGRFFKGGGTEGAKAGAAAGGVAGAGAEGTPQYKKVLGEKTSYGGLDYRQVSTQVKVETESAKAEKSLAKEMMTPGSIYTHDTHVEKILLALLGAGGMMAPVVGMFGKLFGKEKKKMQPAGTSGKTTLKESIAPMLPIMAPLMAPALPLLAPLMAPMMMSGLLGGTAEAGGVGQPVIGTTAAEGIDYSMKREQVNVEPKTTFAEGSGIDAISKNTAKLDQLVAIKDTIQSLLDYFTGGGELTGAGPETGAGSTTARKTARSPALSRVNMPQGPTETMADSNRPYGTG
jgi:phage-related protein